MRDGSIPSLNVPNIISDAFTRPANTTVYAVGDAMADSASAPTANELALVTRKVNGYALIKSATLIDSAAQETPGDFEAWLFNAAPGLDNDNAAFTPTDAELLTLVAVIPFYNKNVDYNATGPVITSYTNPAHSDGDATAGAGGNRVIIKDNLNKLVKSSATSRSLFWVLVARNAYTPVSAETFTLKLDLLQD